MGDYSTNSAMDRLLRHDKAAQERMTGVTNSRSVVKLDKTPLAESWILTPCTGDNRRLVRLGESR